MNGACESGVSVVVSPALPLGTWARVGFHLSITNHTATVLLNGKVAGTLVLQPSWTPAVPKINLGYTYVSKQTTAWSIHIDNVVLERLPVSSTIRVSEVEVCWESVATKVYQVQYRSTLTASMWTNWGGPVQGNGGTMCIKDAVPAGEPQRFYRVMTP